MPAAPRGHERLRGLISVKLMLTVNPASASLFSPEMVRKRMEEEKEEDDAVAVSRVMMLRVCALEKREAHAVHAHSVKHRDPTSTPPP